MCVQIVFKCGLELLCFRVREDQYTCAHGFFKLEVVQFAGLGGGVCRRNKRVAVIGFELYGQLSLRQHMMGQCRDGLDGWPGGGWWLCGGV